jgi:zinc protease
VRAPRPAEPAGAGPRTVTVRDEKVQEPQVQRAYVVPSAVTAEAGEAEALSLLSEILGGGATSRFYDKLVRGDGPATYAGASYLMSGMDDTRFVIYGLPKPGVDLRALETRMDEVLAEIQEHGVTEEELARAKRSAVAQAVYSLDNQTALANIVGQALTIGRTLEDVQNWPARIQAVTAEEVQAVARKYLQPEVSATGYLEPEQEGRS